MEDELNKWFESDILKGTLGKDGIIGEMVSVDHPTSAFVLLHHVMGDVTGKQGHWVFIEGGMGRLTQILEERAKEEGVEVRVNSAVEEILT